MEKVSRTSRAGTLAGDRPSIAVLPFANLGADPDQRYFSDGITEDIITELSRFRELLVIGRGSSFACEAFAHDTSRVGQELGVRYLLEGSIRRAGNRLRITGQLIDSRGGDQIWADRHDGSLDDILELQTAIAAQIAGSIVPEIQHAELRRAERLPIASVQAYDLALKASALIARGINPPDRTLLSEAIALAQEAIAFDPLCHRAHYALSWAYCRRGVIGGIGPQPYGDLDHADAAALRLRELDESNHAAYAILGHIGMRRLRHEEALANLRRAHDLNPNDVTTLRWLSWEESNWGLADDAREHAELSIRLSPRDRLIDASYWTLALAAFVAGDCAGCITHAKKAIALNRQFTGYYLLVAACLAENGALEEARAAAEEIRRLTPGLLESRLEGRTYFAVPALADRYRRALERAAGLAAGQHRPDPPASRAGGLTDRERGVLSLIAQGLSNARIAAALDLSEHTVKRHVANILLKLDLPTRAAAVSWASKHGVL